MLINIDTISGKVLRGGGQSPAGHHACPYREPVVVTMDAAHTNTDTAEHLTSERGSTYIMTTKGNQSILLEAVFKTCLPLVRTKSHHSLESPARTPCDVYVSGLSKAGNDGGVGGTGR